MPFWVARTDGAGDSSPYAWLFQPRIGLLPALGEVERRAAGGEQHRDVGAGPDGVHRVGVEPDRAVPAEAPLLAGPDRLRRVEPVPDEHDVLDPVVGDRAGEGDAAGSRGRPPS